MSKEQHKALLGAWSQIIDGSTPPHLRDGTCADRVTVYMDAIARLVKLRGYTRVTTRHSKEEALIDQLGRVWNMCTQDERATIEQRLQELYAGRFSP